MEENSLSLFDPILWHRRFMHASTGAIQRMACKIPGLKQFDYDFTKCDACLQGGGKKLPLHFHRQNNLAVREARTPSQPLRYCLARHW